MRNWLVLALGLLAQSAFARCHNECVLYNFAGNCIQSVRVCDPPSPQEIVQDPLGALRSGFTQIDGVVRPVRREIGSAIALVSERLPPLALDEGQCAIDSAIFAVTAFQCATSEAGQGIVAILTGETIFIDKSCYVAPVAGYYALQSCFGSSDKKSASAPLLEALNEPRFAAIAANPTFLQALEAEVTHIATRSNPVRAAKRFLAMADFPVFDKGGNNGTVSCDTYCAGAQWVGLGATGICSGAVRADTGARLSCEEVPGLIPSGGLRCSCARSEIKIGNNGYASCRQYCEGRQWGGWAGRCVAGHVAGRGPIDCDTFAGFPNDVSCSCTRY